MAARAVRLETPAYGHGFADMQPLKKIVGNARIVSLGEAPSTRHQSLAYPLVTPSVLM